jgi:hypothetical protein
MFTELGKVIAQAYEDMESQAFNVGDGDNQCISCNAVMSILHRIEYQAKMTEKELAEARG